MRKITVPNLKKFSLAKFEAQYGLTPGEAVLTGNALEYPDRVEAAPFLEPPNIPIAFPSAEIANVRAGSVNPVDLAAVVRYLVELEYL